jgi:HK97 family phage major capsid protein
MAETRTEEVLKQKGLLSRWFQADGWEVRKAEGGGKDIITFSASSEEPVERWWGTEILSHDPAAVNLARAKAGAMPFLFNHNTGDPVGMIVGARVKDGKLMVDASMFDTARAKEVQAMMDGGLRNVSIRYQIETIEENVKTETFTATRWMPHEVSIAPVPADFSVGLGRNSDGAEYEIKALKVVRSLQAAGAANHKEGAMATEAGTETVVPVKPNVVVVEGERSETVRKMEADRIKAIENLCTMNKIDERHKEYWIRSGLSLNEVTDDMLSIMAERGKHNPQSPALLGLTERETQNFSLVRAIKAIVDNNWNNAPFELECSRAIAKEVGKTSDPRRFFVPFEVQARANQTPVERLAERMLQRDLTVASGAGGGFLVQTSNVSFLEILRNKSVLFNMGATRLSGLRDSVTIPKMTVAATTTWLANEAAQISESTQTFAQVALSPKTVGGYTEISRQLMLQSNPSIEGIVSSDLAQVVALDIDLKGLNGSGSAGQPLGLIGTSGVGSVVGTSIAYAGIIEFQTDVFAGNALNGRCGYIATGVVAGLLKQRVKFSSTASQIWEGRLDDGSVDGYRAMASNQVPTGDLIFGDWSQLIVAEWGVLEVEVNPFADFKAGIVGVRAIASIDIGIRYPVAFSVATSVT